MIEQFSEKDYKISEWPGGLTSEIYIFPRDACYADRNFLFRISSATIQDQCSNFTVLKEVTRFISPLDDDLRLEFGDGRSILLKPMQICQFSGSLKTTSYGKTRDFNLMIKKVENAFMEVIHFQNTEFHEPKISGENFMHFFVFDGRFAITIDEKIYDLTALDSLMLSDIEAERPKIQALEPGHLIICRIWI